MKPVIRTIILSILCCNAFSHADAQAVARSTDTTKKSPHALVVPKPKGPKPITHEMSVGFRLNSNGWSGYADLGHAKTKDMKHIDMFHNVRFWQLEVTEKKDPHEYKSTSSNGSGTNTYIYGKINNFYGVKLGRGYRTLLAGKPDPGCVSIHWVNAGGVSVGLIKPYYLNVYPNTIKYTEGTQSDFLNQGIIEGSAGFGKGLNEVKIDPGFHLKSALHFDFSANRKNVIAIEAGMNFEYYSTAVQLMANQSAVPYFFDIFAAVQFGRRW
jgi:hypothetical protein